ncbi:MAG: type III restriction-modification system endonuclease [Bacillota bacterium]
MGLILEKGLKHQVNALIALNRVFRDVDIKKGSKSFANPLIDIESVNLRRNLLDLKKGLPYQNENSNIIDDYLNIDIKMETGTGKTYVYTQSVFELHRNYGITKFIILVPSVAIKLGTINFINSSETRRHFREMYGTEIDLSILDAKKNKKEIFPNAIREFVSASGLIKNQISVLVINNVVSQSSLTKNYSSGVEGFYNPIDALKATKPFIIIDEPHRFGKDQKTFNFLQDRIKPQCIIRFGATFPELKGGKKDYHNLVYNLSSCDSFNQNLIKGVSVTPLETPNGTNVKLKLKSVVSKTSASFEINNTGRKRDISIEFKKGDSLGLAFDAFAGLNIDGIGKNFIELSNGLLLNVGQEIFADIYDKSYQESMIDVALDSHFSTEKKNFCRRDQIKTIALFFIDDISSYRGSTDRTPYLREYFESALIAKTKEEIAIIDNGIPREVEYKKFLEDSLKDISATHGGYFSQDNSDKEFEEEIEKILKKKEETISLKYANGKYNTFRFIFSKWTLKEGWDNPNVFTIAKIRSSGSEISKIQEVGRGLRLPVNSSFSRVSNEQFYLNYIVDFTEKNFAQRLIDEINGDLLEQLTLMEDVVKKVAKDSGMSYFGFMDFLVKNNFINEDRVVNTEKRDDLFALYPDLMIGLASGKIVTTPPKAIMHEVKIDKTNYLKLKDLWKSLNSKYFITYLPLKDDEIVKALLGILKDGIEKKVEVVATTKTVMFNLLDANLEDGAQRTYSSEETMKYNEFLMRVNKSTSIPLKLIHHSFVEYYKLYPFKGTLFNRASLTFFVMKIIEWKKGTLFGKFKYEKMGLEPSDTSINDKNWNSHKTITQGLLGRLYDKNSKPPINYLYDLCVYDSKIEKDNIQSDVQGVEVFGKIPKGSIRIPVINGGSYSPDFMYVVKRNGEVSELNLVIESKGYDKAEDIPVDELFKIKCAEVFFKQLESDGVKVEFKTQINADKMYNIIRGLM